MDDQGLGPAPPPGAVFSDTSADRLMDPANHLDDIALFIRTEREMIETLAPLLDRIVELGCMDGRYLELAARYGVRYVGVDLVPRHVQTGRLRARALGLGEPDVVFRQGDAQRVHVTLADLALDGSAERNLLLFPFGLFGALPDVDDAAASLGRLGWPFLLSLYQPGDRMTAARRRYYARCGYEAIRVVRDRRGVWLTTGGGLRVAAYHPSFLRALWTRHGLAVETVDLSPLNLLCASDVAASWIRERRAAPQAVERDVSGRTPWYGTRRTPDNGAPGPCAPETRTPGTEPRPREMRR